MAPCPQASARRATRERNELINLRRILIEARHKTDGAAIAPREAHTAHCSAERFGGAALGYMNVSFFVAVDRTPRSRATCQRQRVLRSTSRHRKDAHLPFAELREISLERRALLVIAIRGGGVMVRDFHSAEDLRSDGRYVVATEIERCQRQMVAHDVRARL